MKRRAKQAVTLVELLLVVVILGLVAGITFPSMHRNLENQEVQKALETLYTIANAVKDYQAGADTFPPSITDLENRGYLSPNEYYNRSSFTYSIRRSGARFAAEAVTNDGGRTITLCSSQVGIADDGVVFDSAGRFGVAGGIC